MLEVADVNRERERQCVHLVDHRAELELLGGVVGRVTESGEGKLRRVRQRCTRKHRQEERRALDPMLYRRRNAGVTSGTVETVAIRAASVQIWTLRTVLLHRP